MKKKNNKSKSITYKESGVDIDKFEIILNDLKKEILSFSAFLLLHLLLPF